ncbi:Uncharacterized protein APZ42_034234 [Daphnia magna]|uniref:Uncharacterized protein n=1 Tax=Daphnia magna TaxID=35525 RepID=A0A164KBB3_9CRUS|nr:Uncharacterized protein APZ42_034234 [Daphnia magna]
MERTIQISRTFSLINYEIQHTVNKKLKPVLHTNRLKLNIRRKQETTDEEEILQNLPENVEAQRRPTIHQRRQSRPRKLLERNKTKNITGSFWIGSFGTVYSQEIILITPLEYWRMVNNKKYGSNNMKVGPTGLSFTATPTEEGKWYAIKEYQTLNCIAQQITLRQEKPDRPIESPFGLLNTTQQEGQFSQNQNTIV